ncbi:HtaA domain-containing protein [Isoptericola halotolerans]|uniref:Htaa domain-containing protein n=1 Tax=Isoptericola halotolerans TaxID=300560 RepID=A0ABX2A9J7_9MICO|nr:HtaA domain-containing protein [Isoptericola halotolerans]NOV98461.1 hypothetical protein [Isoptericola halotolerans]
MTTPPRPPARSRLAAGLGVLALGLGATLVTVAPAQAAEAREVVTGTGDVSWGYKESFRRYVGNQTAALPPIGALPMGERITRIAPGQFDTSATPASTSNTSTPNETLPWTLPVTGGSYTSADDLVVESAGGAAFHFPSHYFDVTIENVSVVVSGGDATVVADVTADVTGDFGDWEAGTYGGEDVEFATASAVDATLDGDTLRVSLTGLTTTADGAAALPLYAAGDPLDNLTLTAELDEAPASWTPAVQVSQTEGFDPATSTTITVTGSGFDPTANISARQPVAVGQPTGVYVVVGKFAETWKPSDGAASAARTVISQKWALPEPSYTQVRNGFPNVADQLVLMNDDGTFSVDLEVSTHDTVSGAYGVYTYAAGGAAPNAAQESAVPLRFAKPTADGEGEVGVDVEVPGSTDPVDPDPEPGSFSWTINGAGAVNLGTAQAGDTAFTATGALHQVTVSDTRPDGTWSINGAVGRFVGGSGSFSGAALGWTPQVTSGAAVAGSPVVAGSGLGLTQTSTLASGTGATGSDDAVVDAGLSLRIPLDTPAGDYTGVLTLTAVG